MAFASNLRTRIQRRVARLLSACLVAAVGSLVWGQTDDFNDGNDNLQVWVDGQPLAPAELTTVSGFPQPGSAVPFSRADIAWTVTTGNWEGAHTNKVVFEDSDGVKQTNI